MQEIWKDISGYEGIYQVSNLGRVRSITHFTPIKNDKKIVYGKILNQTPITSGYLSVNFCVNKKRKKCLVHRLVAQAFIPNPQNLTQVNHIDENKLNNDYRNLEWCTYEYNNNYGSHNEKIAKPIYCIELSKTFSSLTQASKELGINMTSLSRSCNNPKHTCGGFHWKFTDSL